MLGAALIVTLMSVQTPPPSQRCASEVAMLWRELVEGGCRLPKIEDRLPLALRLLRNTPYAARGHRFEAKVLGRFFKRAHEKCVWYRPTDVKVVLPKRELGCAQKLAKLERADKKKIDLPAPMEAFLLEGGLALIVGEMKRAVRGQKGAARVEVIASGEEWTLIFNEVEGETESSTIVTCDAQGEHCRVDFAG
ncbi:MAG: YARHG domain-containing protein [Deltaproteobacteria bacterium]